MLSLPFTQLASFALLLGLTPSVLGQEPDPEGTTLFLSQPSCNYYQCVIQWDQCSQQLVQWLNPPQAYVKVQLVARYTSDVYTIADSIEPINTCSNITTQLACGETSLTVGLWNPGMYSVVVSNVDDPAIVGYTDLISLNADPSCKEASRTASASDSPSISSSGVMSKSNTAKTTEHVATVSDADPNGLTVESSASALNIAALTIIGASALALLCFDLV